MSERLASLTLHAEKLHDDRVWRRVDRLASAFASRGEPLTFFVHPFWATRAGRDISRRVQRLARLGHEVGQHTHYYDGETGATPGHKETDLSAGNVLARLDEDHGLLREMGVQPTGFVSGGWALPDALPGWLAERGFTYDCSHRTCTLPYESAAPAPGDSTRSPFRLGRGLMEVPTTSPLRAGTLGVLRRRMPVVRSHDLEYQLVYLHDDDLLDARKRTALGLLARGLRARGCRLTSAHELAATMGARVGADAP